ncbi:hypothetical protein GCK72_011558 [Caenorhabditis remanei]|uniref:Uncharacterized protein n=1 Tax=Caenorhabditis remanei TaxID=31234 RepID=A0A6A5HA81_CAERE|nr:hypothetical protein GCK72_011558 [Caenorhabditis remanei]KAF1763292.1 hypothetical protein GCK72_011558 [Caenorhabditis remanei]
MMRSQSNIVYTQNQSINGQRGGASMVVVQNGGQMTTQQLQPLRQSTLERLPPPSNLEKFQQMQEMSRLQQQHPHQLPTTAQSAVPCILNQSVQLYHHNGHLTSSEEPSINGKSHNRGYGAMSSQCKEFMVQSADSYSTPVLQTTNYKSSGDSVTYSNPVSNSHSQSTTYSTPDIQTTNSGNATVGYNYSNPGPVYSNPLRQMGSERQNELKNRPWRYPVGYIQQNRQNQPNPPQVLLVRSNTPQSPQYRQIPYGKQVTMENTLIQPVQPLVPRPTQNQSLEKNQTMKVKKYSRKGAPHSSLQSLQKPSSKKRPNLIEMALLDAEILESDAFNPDDIQIIENPVKNRSKIDKNRSKNGKIPDLIKNIAGFEIRVIRAKDEAWRVFPNVV